MQCSFCGTAIARGTGKMYVKVDGRIYYFCSSKCEKNMITLHRNPRTTRWTAEHQRLKDVEKSSEEAKAQKPAKESKAKKTEKKEA